MGAINKLSAAAVAKAKMGRYGDGGGLILQVTSGDAKSWIFRYISPTTGKAREMGLGSSRAYSLKEARELADAARKLVGRGVDPITERDAHAMAQKHTVPTFAECADAYIKANRISWVERYTIDQQRAIERYVPFGDKPVSDITIHDMKDVLMPLWAKRQVALGSRLRSLIERILDAAKANGHRNGENPARWRGNLSTQFPKAARVYKTVNRPSLPYDELPDFMQRLRSEQMRVTAARALEFTILTAVRTKEAAGARWDEIKDGVWTVPAERMKTRKAHTVPLSSRAQALLAELSRMMGSPYVFPGVKGSIHQGAMLELLHLLQPEVTVHGFRATFSSWASDCTSASHETIEAALAHELPNAVAAAYKRTTQMEKRRLLMEQWASFCAGQKAQLRVVS